MPLNTIPNKGLTSRGYPSDRLVTPIIINGDMSVAQRGTSVSGITSTAYYTLDRIRTNISSLGTWTQSRSTDVPTGQGFAYSLKMDCTTADASPSASDYLNVEQRFEGQNLQNLKKGTSNAESLTLSFWVKSNKTGTYIAEIIDTDNDRNNVNAYTINSANTWEKKTITLSGDTTGTLTNDNNVSMRATFWLGAGSDYTSGTLQSGWGARNNANRLVGQVNLADSTSNEWYITGVQLEVGEFDSTTIPSFPFESYESNLRKCQRYFETFPSNGGDGVIGYGYGSGSDTARTMFPFKVTKRSAPTMSDSLSTSRQYRINFTATDGTAVNQNSSNTPGFGSVCTLNSGYMNLSGFSSIGGGHNGFLIYNNSTTLLSADAEL